MIWSMPSGCHAEIDRREIHGGALAMLRDALDALLSHIGDEWLRRFIAT
jgi:hypothetical protein